MHTINKELKELKNKIENKLQHSYVNQFVKKPFIDENKLELLSLIYHDIRIPQYIKQQHMITTMLVQLALDTHDKVPNQHQEWLMDETEKQLSVLVGDYYSGLYYLMLSEIEEVNMIQVIASAIRKINENKVTLFYEEITSIQELLEVICHIEASLFTGVATYLGHDQLLLTIIEDLLLINRLTYEQKAEKGIVSTFFVKHEKEMDTHDKIMAEIKRIIQAKKEQLESNLLQLPYQHTKLKNTILNKMALSYNTSFVEEG